LKTAIYPGSFDPITMGHIDIIRRLAPLYDPLIVVVANSESKDYLFDLKSGKISSGTALRILSPCKCRVGVG